MRLDQDRVFTALFVPSDGQTTFSKYLRVFVQTKNPDPPPPPPPPGLRLRLALIPHPASLS